MSENVNLLSRRDNGFISKNTEPGKVYRWMDPDNFSWYHGQNERLGENWKYHNSKGDITYTYNSDGFRNEKTMQDLFIPHDDYIVVIGSSQIEGIGVWAEDTMAKKLQKKIGTHVYNMGMSGTATFEQFNNLTNLICNYHAPKAVIMTGNTSKWTTIEVEDKPGYYMKVGPWIEFFKKHIAGNRGDEFTDKTIEYYNSRIATKKDLHEDEMLFSMAKQLCDKVGSKLIMLEVFEGRPTKHIPGITPDDVDWIEIDNSAFGAIFQHNDHDFMMRYTRYKEKELPAEDLNTYARDAIHQGAEYNEWVTSRVQAILEKDQ